MTGNFEEGYLLRVFVSESDKFNKKPLYRAIVEKAKELDLKGATVVKGLMGFGATSKIHTSDILVLNEDMPLIIEIVDSKENLEKILPFLNFCMKGGMVTIEKATVILYEYSENK